MKTIKTDVAEAEGTFLTLLSPRLDSLLDLDKSTLTL